MKRLLMTGLVCGLTGFSFADDSTSVRYDTATGDRVLVAHEDTDRDWMSYKANEVNLSIFGSGTLGETTLRDPSSKKIRRNGKLGAGAGLSYFFCRYVGVEGYAYSESTGGRHFVDNVGGDLVGRLPIGNSGVAPYIFAGGARQLDPLIQWTLDAGGGVEWRFAPHVGVFVDARYVWADETKDYGLGRLGLKVGF